MSVASTRFGDPADPQVPMQSSVFGEIDRDAAGDPQVSSGDSPPRGSSPGTPAKAPHAPAAPSAAAIAAGVWIDPPEKPRPTPPSREERSAQDLAIEILRVARQEVLASANPCAIESPFIVARRAKRMLEDRIEAGAARDAVDAAIDRLVDRA